MSFLFPVVFTEALDAILNVGSEVKVFVKRVLGFFERPINFIKESWAELKKVSWPSWSDTWTFTKVVLFIIILIGIYMGILDAFFGWLMHALGIYRF
jgi:preprotein translocase SecE subunit